MRRSMHPHLLLRQGRPCNKAGSVACCLQGMAASAPQQVQAAIREPVEKLLRGNQVEDRTRTCAAIELLCGLLASGKVFEAQGKGC